MIPLADKWMDYPETVEDLKRAIDRPAYILTGDEVFLIEQVRVRLLSALLTPGSEGLDAVSFKGDGNPNSIDFSALQAEISTPPFFSDNKVIFLDRTGFFDGSRSKDLIPAALEAILISLPEHCHLVFREEGATQNSLLKKMRKSGALSAKFGRQTNRDLQLWVSGLCRREACRITREAADSLIRRCDYAMSDILNELTTVFLYFAYTGKKDIGLADIDYLCREDLTGKIFDLTDAIAAGKIDQALERLDILLARREPPLFIQTMLARQTRDLLVARESGTSDRIIGSGVTQSRFFAGKLASQARRFTADKLEAMLETCFQADLAVKSGRLDGEDALAILVIRACGLA